MIFGEKLEIGRGERDGTFGEDGDRRKPALPVAHTLIFILPHVSPAKEISLVFRMSPKFA